MPKISIIIPSFNHEKYIALTIQSILDQTFQDFEIVIVDDASTDNTIHEIEKIHDKRIRLFKLKENHGASYAANRCIKESRGKYISLVSSDDIFMPEKLAQQLEYFDRYPKIGAVFSYAQIIDENGKDLRDPNHFYSTIFIQPERNRFEWLNFFFHHGNCLCHPSVMIKKETYKSLGYYDDRLAQIPDLDLWVRMCLKHELHIIPENLVKFRVRKGKKNMSAIRPESSVRHTWELVQVLKAYLNIQNTNDLLRIFPEVKKYGNKLHSHLIGFYIAMLALERKWAPYQMFGLETLNTLLGSKKIADELKNKHGFRYSDFIKLTGNSDPMNFYEVHFRDAKISELESKIKPKRKVLKNHK